MNAQTIAAIATLYPTRDALLYVQTQVYGGGFCTRTEADRFFSYRRAQKSGRMGAFIWITG